MDSSIKNPSYDLWQPPSASLLPPVVPPPFHHQFHSKWLNCYDRSRQIYRHYHQDFHKHMHRQELPWESAVNEPPSYYFQPSPVLHESPWISQLSYNFSCTEPRDLSQSAWIGYMESRFDTGSDHNYQLDYGHPARDCSNGVFNRDWDGNSRSRDGFCSFGYARQESGDVRIEESYRDCGQFNLDSDGYCRWPGTGFGYGNFPYGNWGTGNQRWVEEPKEGYYHSKIERRFYNGKRKGSDKPNRTTKKPRQNESLLLLETPRPHQGRENDRSRLPAHFIEKRFRGKNHSDCETVEKQTANGKETNCTAGKVIFPEATTEKENISEPTLSDIENCSEGGIPFGGNSMHSLLSQPCKAEVRNKDMDDLSSRNLHMEEAESNNVSQSQACENGVNSSVVTVSTNESMETTPLNSTTQLDNNLGRDAGKYVISISPSRENVAGMGSSSVQPGERNYVSLPNICKNKEGWSNGSVLDRELSSAMYLEGVSLTPNEDLGHDSAEILSVDQSCDLSCKGMKICLTESNVSLSKDIKVGASEFHLKQEVREEAPTCDQFSSSPVSEIETSLIGNIGSSGSKTVTDPEAQPSSAGCKFLPNGHFGFGASDVVASLWMSSVDKDLLDDSLRISSVRLCHHSPSVSVNEQIQNSASSAEANCSSHCGIIEKGMGRAENMDVDIQEEKVKLTGETSQCETSGTDFVTVSGDSMLQCGSSSILPRLITGQIQNETHAAAKVEKTNDCKEEILLDESPSNSDVLLSKLHSHADEKFGVSHVKDYVVSLPHPDSQSKRSSSSISMKTEKRERKYMHAAQKSYTRSLYDTRKDANHPINVTKHHTWHQKSNTPASPLGKAHTLQRHSKPPSDSTSSEKCALSPGMDPLANGICGSSSGEAPDFVQNGLKSSNTLVQTGYCQQKQNPPKLESSKMLYVKRKANQLVATSDIHGASNSEIPPSSGYFKRSKNQLFRNSKSLANQAKSLTDAALVSQTGGKMVPKRSSSSALSQFAVVRPFNQSKCTLVWTLREPLSRKANGVLISPQKIVQQPVSRKRVTYCRSLMNPTSVLRNVSFSTIRSVWIRNGSQLVRDPKKRTRVLTNEKVRWSVHNARFRLAKRRNYCQFFTRFGECNKDDGKCPYLHDPSKIAVCTKFPSGLCANPDCKLAHKVVPESMSDCYYFLQGLCNKESCAYRHVHVHQNAAICEGFLRGYCLDGNECRKKHTYTCQVFEATGSCPQGSDCKLHHPKNRSKGKKRKRASEPWQQNSRGRYFGSMFPESEPMLVNELAGEVFGEEGLDFIRIDVSEKEGRENMDSSTTESVSDVSEDQNSTDEFIRPVRLMQK